ncbi:MAG: hypothetical protein CMM06_08255 [Rhodopirellula sp.]|nr:hypothetical protein [Rhodopirellula sp.]
MNVDFTVFKEGQALKTINVALPVIIGRGTDSTLTIKHPLLSRRHCEVYDENGQVMVKDLASLNGTFVNESRVETSLSLSSGAKLKLGSVEMQVVFEGVEAGDAAEADFDMGVVASAQTEPLPVADDTPAEAEDAAFDLGDFEVSEPVADESPAVVGDAVAEAESLDLGDFEVGTPEVAPADDMLDLSDFEVAAPAADPGEPEAQVELPSLMELAGGLDEEVAEAAAAAEATPAEPIAEVDAPADPWAPPTENQVTSDDDDLDAFLADLG